MLTKVFSAIFGDANEKVISSMQPYVDQINDYEANYKELTDDELKAKTDELKQRYQLGTSLDELLPEAFATVRETSRRVLQMRHFDVQLLGGMTLHKGDIAEMKTGEGKTLVATLPAYLNALTGEGVHIVTTNDYLAKRDAEWMGQIHRFLGLTVDVVVNGMTSEQRQKAYSADITYGTNNEFGFDYLRDNMATQKSDMVQRGHSFAIVDEVDSILIDEARTPLIISAPGNSVTDGYVQYAQVVKKLSSEHFTIDEKQRSISLTEDGISKLEEIMQRDNLYAGDNFSEIHHIEQALKAEFVFKKDQDYLVSPEGEVMIIDEFTGRAMAGRRFSEGIHQAIEAKEGVKIKQESKTLASITYQNYFRLYKKLSGMTGTALTEAEEFANIYDLGVTVIPTNRPLARDDQKDAVYKNEKGKYAAIVEKIKEVNAQGQPILVGTTSVEKSEFLSKELTQAGIKHNVLNAKQHEREAEIVEDAGQKGAVTIATNMAGRGTDIKLGEGIEEIGGLYILGTERHESRRIDNQLRGRAGRQGDKGISKFYLSMGDDVMKRFGSEKIIRMMDRLGLPEDVPIENNMITRSIESAQKKIEGYNFDIRKHILKYDDIMNKHREIIYKKRKTIIENESVRNDITDYLVSEIKFISKSHYDVMTKKFQKEELIKALNEIVKIQNLESIINWEQGPEEIDNQIIDIFKKAYQKKIEENEGSDKWAEVEKQVSLKVLDTLWMEHIDSMSHLRENVSLQGYGQRDPLIIYKDEAFKMFENLLGQIQHDILRTIFHVQIIKDNEENKAEAKPEEKKPEPQNSDAGSAIFYKKKS